MEEDYNFDMTEYEEEDQKNIVNSIYDKSNKPAITNLKSKFSCGQFELEALSTIKNEISKYGIKVASASNEIKDLWTFYGCCNEYWARIHDIFGTVNINEINHIKKNCLILFLIKFIGICYFLEISCICWLKGLI